MNEKETKTCSCGGVLRFAYTADFRVGGTIGGWKLPFGELAEAGENVLPLDIYVCPNCGKIELYAGESMKDSLLCLAKKHG